MLQRFTSRVAPIFLRGVGRRSLAEYREEDEMSPQSAKAEKSVNQINLLGRLGRDAELRGTVEHPVVVFTMATNFLYTKQDGEKVIHTDWHRVSVFRPGLRENIATYLRKGDRVFVTGNMRYDEYMDSNNKPQRSATVIAADIVNLTKRYLEEQG